MTTNKSKSIVLLLITLCTQKLFAQKSVDYGSNNGKYIEVYGKKLYYEEYGSGVPLILLHGGLGTISTFKHVIPQLSKHFRVIAIDAPGQGRSEQADSLSFELMASFYSKMIDELKLDSVYVYGFSVGSITGMHLAADRPDKVKMLIAHSGTYRLDGYNEKFGNTNEITPEVVENHIQWWLQGHLKRTPQKEQWKKFINDFRKMWASSELIPVNKLKEIKCPVLIMQGDQDLVKAEYSIQMQNLISSSQLCILPNSTHFALDENPDLVVEIATNFLLKKKPNPFTLSY